MAVETQASSRTFALSDLFGGGQKQRRQERTRPLSNYNPSTAEKELLSLVENKFQLWSNYRYEFERVWYSNIAMYLGFQYHTWQAGMQSLWAPIVPEWRVRLVANQIFSIVQTRVAKMTRNRPTISVIPATTDDDDLAKARVAEKVLDHLDQTLGLAVKRYQAAVWANLCGTAFMKVYPDMSKGELVEVPMYDDAGQPKLTETQEAATQLLNIGEVGVEVITPFEIYPDLSATTMDDLRAFIHARAVHIDAAKLSYPHIAEFIAPEQDYTNSSFFRSRIRGMVALQRYAPSTNMMEQEDVVVVREYHEKPSREFPRGRIITVVGGVIAEVKDNPYGDEFNIVKIDDNFVPGRFWGESTVTQLTPLQKTYNRGRSQIKEIKNLMSMPKWLLPNGSGTIESSINDEPGEVIQYTPQMNGAKPEVIQPATIPQYMLQDLEMDLQDMERIGGVTDVSRGVNPSNVKSGIQVQMLAELDETKFGPLIQAFERSMEQVARLTLKCVKKIYTEPRLVRILGDNRRMEVFEFTSSQMPEKYDVRVQAGSALPKLKAAQQDFVLQMWDRGLIVNERRQPDPLMAAKLLQFGNYDRFMETIEQDERNAHGEFMSLKRGELTNIRVEPFDNDDVHVESHDRDRKGDWYRRLDPEHPYRKFFDAHVNLHLTQKQMKMMGVMLSGPEMGMGLGGMPPMPPPGMGSGKPPTGETEQMQEGAGGQQGGMKSRPGGGNAQGQPGPPPGAENGM